MTFQELDKMLRRYTKDEQIQKETGELWFDLTDVNTRRMVENYKRTKRLSFFQDLQSCPERFKISKQSRFAPVPEHSHNWFEIQYVYTGHSSGIVNGEPVTLPEGGIMCLDTDVVHSVDAAEAGDIIVNLLIHEDYCKKFLSNPFHQKDSVSRLFSSILSDRVSHNRYVIVQETPELHFFMRYLMCQYFSETVISQMVYENAISLILAEMSSALETSARESGTFGYENAVLIQQYISSNFRTCTLQSVADFFKISPGYLTKMIKKQTGMSYKQLIQDLKLTCAENLLAKTQMPVGMVCYESGYENQSHFYKLFYQKYGCTPNEYRSSLILPQ